jgi:hypothetical protein
LEDVIPLELPILDNELAVKVRNEEDDGENTHANGDAQNNTNIWARTPFLDLWQSTGSSLPHDKHGEDTGGKSDVEWDSDERSTCLDEELGICCWR